jgi:phenol 2-monooxygenase
MNVSLQDGFNLGWKLGHVLEGRSPVSLLGTYSAERQVIAKNLIDFDREWSTLMATRPEEMEDPSELERFYVSTAEFPAGFMTQYPPSSIIGASDHQQLATGFPIGKRFRSALVRRVCDANDVHLGHLAAADGRWRIYVFADTAAAGVDSPVTNLAHWLTTAADSPIVSSTRAGEDVDVRFDVKVIYQQDHASVDINAVPMSFKPLRHPFALVDYNNVFACDPEQNVFDLRGIDRGGAIVVVRPDQYVANVLPLTATAGLAEFLRP